MPDESKLVLTIKNSRPVDVRDLAECMLGVSNEYQRYVEKELGLPPVDAGLYVKDVRSGSIITELVGLTSSLLPYMEDINTLVAFGGGLVVLLNWLAGNKVDRPAVIEKKTLENIMDIVDPIAKDAKGSFRIDTVNVNGEISVHYHFHSPEANTIQNNARREIEILKVPLVGVRNKVLLHWDQAKNQTSNTVGDKAIIESISQKPIRVTFENEELKKKMLFERPYPFQDYFLVDVFVETVEDVPKMYKIIDVHEIFTDNE